MTYELINSETANTLASFASRQEAESAFDELARSDERFARDLVIVAFDDQGLAAGDDGDDEPRPQAEAVEAFSARGQ